MAAGGSDFKNYYLWQKALLSWTRTGARAVTDWFNGWGIDPIVVAPIVFFLLLWIAHATDPDVITATTIATVALSPVTLPIGLFVLFWVAWIHYIRFAYWFSGACDSVLLEITLPPEVEKSPAAMEIFFVALWQTGGETTFIKRIWEGSMRAVFSLEIASDEGQVRFYLYTRKSWRNIVEARLYGQFPEARIVEVEDYVTRIPFNLETYNIWGSEYQKGSGLPQALPIKTYIDFALDRSPDKPETQTDPITNIIELLGSIGKDEHFWMQLIMRGRKQKGDEWYGFYKFKDHYREPGQDGIKQIMKGAVERSQSLVEDPDAKKRVGERGAALLTESERRKVEGIERSLSKLTFEVGVRIVYLAKKERFNGINNGAIVRFFDSFNNPNEYTNRLGVTRGTTYFDYPWQDFMGIRETKEKRNLYFRYRHRAYFGVPYDQPPIFMSVEELATLWHFPSSVVQSPGINRVPAKVAEAPTNLPTGA